MANLLRIWMSSVAWVYQPGLRYFEVYDTPLTIEQILARLEEQPKAIAALTAGLTRARLHSPPSRGEWSVNAVLAHLRSCGSRLQPGHAPHRSAATADRRCTQFA